MCLTVFCLFSITKKKLVNHIQLLTKAFTFIHTTPWTNLRSRCDTEATISTDLWFLLLCISHLGALLLCSFRPCRADMIMSMFSWVGLHYLLALLIVASLKATTAQQHWRYVHLKCQSLYLNTALHLWHSEAYSITLPFSCLWNDFYIEDSEPKAASS